MDKQFRKAFRKARKARKVRSKIVYVAILAGEFEPFGVYSSRARADRVLKAHGLLDSDRLQVTGMPVWR